jgi:hypothetical protein
LEVVDNLFAGLLTRFAVEASMRSHSVQEIIEADDAVYWRDRAAALEGLVSELLIKNQNMRFTLQESEREVCQRPQPVSHDGDNR